MQNKNIRKIKPKKIRLELCSACQLSCPLCTNTTNEIVPVVGKGYLRFNNFKKIVEENPYIKEIEISNYGEVLLNPELIEILQFASKKKISLYAENGVNCNTASTELLEALVKYPIKIITFSIDGVSQNIYSIYRKNGNINTVFENIDKINAFKKKYNSKYPKLIWQYIIFGHNVNEIGTARKIALEKNMLFKLKLSWDSDYSPVKDKEVLKKELKLKLTSREEYKTKKKVNYGRNTCHQLWDEPQINWDGKILGCCVNYWKSFEGNVFQDGLKACLNSESLNYTRKMLLGKKPRNMDTPCYTCSYYKGMQKDNMYLNRNFKYFIYKMMKICYRKINRHLN